MKYEKCLTCPQMGQSCDGPNFLAMDTVELGAWCNAKRKQIPGLTYDKIAAETGISKSAVHGFLNGSHADYRVETIRPIVKLITGGKWDDNPCGSLTNTEKAQYDETLRHCESEIKWRDDKIQHLIKQNGMLEHQIDEKDATIKERGKFMQRKDRWIALLGLGFLFCLITIIGALVIDRLDPSIGFFWLE